MAEECDVPKKSATPTAVNIKSWIGNSVRTIAAVELWGGIAFVVLFALAAIIAAIIAAVPVIKSWIG